MVNFKIVFMRDFIGNSNNLLSNLRQAQSNNLEYLSGFCKVIA